MFSAGVQVALASDNLSALGLEVLPWALVALAGVFFLTSASSMVTASTSLVAALALNLC